MDDVLLTGAAGFIGYHLSRHLLAAGLAQVLDRGIYLAPSAYEVMFISLAHSEDDIDQTIAAFHEAVPETM